MADGSTRLLSRSSSPEVHEVRLRAMGVDAHVVVVGGDPLLLDDARAHLELLEARWSRFRQSSELSRLDANPRRPVVVSHATFEIIARAVEAWWRTGGRFDPTLLPALRVAGYHRELGAGCSGIALDPTTRAVTLPEGVLLDLG